MEDTQPKPLSVSEQKKEDWMNTKWRPAMGWMYMAVCIFDFILAPILWAMIQFWETQAANDAFRQWQPLTLQGAGLFHMAMGAVLGLAAWGRTQEKLGNGTSGAMVPPMTSPRNTAPGYAAPPPVPPVSQYQQESVPSIAVPPRVAVPPVARPQHLQD